jgi:hypothetical protein
MSERDGLQDEMRRLLLGELGSNPLAIDQDTADRLLAGRLDPADAPPGYGEVAKVLVAAAAPALPHELEGEAAATAAFARERLDRRGADSHSAPRRRPPQRRSSVGAAPGRADAAPRQRRASRFAVVAVAVAVLMVGGAAAAAATGTLPGPAQRLVDSVSRSAHHHQPASPSRQGDAGGARNSGHDQQSSVVGGHVGGRYGDGRNGVGPGSDERGATGKASHGVHGAPRAKPGGAHGKGAAASQVAHGLPASGRAEGHRKEKGE